MAPCRVTNSPDARLQRSNTSGKADAAEAVLSASPPLDGHLICMHCTIRVAHALRVHYPRAHTSCWSYCRILQLPVYPPQHSCGALANIISMTVPAEGNPFFEVLYWTQLLHKCEKKEINILITT
jgi:hypothetical protein